MRANIYMTIMLLFSVVWALIGNFAASSAFAVGICVISALEEKS